MDFCIGKPNHGGRHPRGVISSLRGQFGSAGTIFRDASNRFKIAWATSPRETGSLAAEIKWLTWVGLIWSYYANEVIRKLIVNARNFNLRHVAGDAISRRDGTRGSARRGCAERMAGEALGVISRCTGYDRMVRIVAGDATDAGVRRAIAAAARQPITLEPDVLRAANLQHLFLRRCAMADAAEGRNATRRERSGIEDEPLRVAS